ncbi:MULTISPECIES: trans-sulfuration enzyme family protein [Pedobacter]|uniref:Cystathionine gamma-lyase n=1 Tax=Pedobacter heparinus (strain ATCC 13125 / DSM 2366 / CIP 104194 / JCM 7457 / NBRC 12017 / NCIMB 9290 / NRRL B-14731 / HIM 762-3) TaxID=485917 RepID=C6XW05_PEDHD|nr:MULTISPECIES: aminotransferase class I/II-fold pyridoxal phosphate-dependent enzyme [Pedobacter]ACU04084.1 Cystathionine gamma-lyase [Pedobacter heparinus DSM 2366]MBB5436463.1 cystathionine gamma-synthase [Pedobacter sp. AK017]
MRAETLAIHAGNLYEPHTKDVTAPINLSTTFLRDADGGYSGGHMYSRMSNPNRAALEKTMAELEKGADACAFSSGNTAGMSVFQALKPGSHILAPDDMYWGFKRQLQSIFADTIEIDFIDLTNPDLIGGHIRKNTVMIWVETPSNPLLKITDIAAIAQIARSKGLILACDSTFASPCLQNPIALGANIVMHSSTKYIGGHSDVLGGVLVTAEKDELWEKIRNIQQVGGAVPSPFDCFLLSRSIKTLAYRMRGHCENGMALALYLEKHPVVEAVFYPGLPTHPGHETARQQMTGFGGMLSILIKGGADEARRVVNKMKLFAQATSLGGVESLIEHRASIEGPDTKTPQNLIRISAGLEHIDDLIADFEQALS